MNKGTLIAEPYARAAFEFAKLHDLTYWLSVMQCFAEMAVEPKMQLLLKDPMLTNTELLDAFVSVCEGLIDAHQLNFLRVVAENRRLAYLPYMYQLFLDYYDSFKRRVEVQVYTPFVLSTEYLQKLQTSLEKRLNSGIEISQHPDKSLIGGAVIRIGDEVIDGSVKGRLNRLATHLNLKENLCQ